MVYIFKNKPNAQKASMKIVGAHFGPISLHKALLGLKGLNEDHYKSWDVFLNEKVNPLGL